MVTCTVCHAPEPTTPLVPEHGKQCMPSSAIFFQRRNKLKLFHQKLLIFSDKQLFASHLILCFIVVYGKTSKDYESLTKYEHYLDVTDIIQRVHKKLPLLNTEYFPLF